MLHYCCVLHCMKHGGKSTPLCQIKFPAMCPVINFTVYLALQAVELDRSETATTLPAGHNNGSITISRHQCVPHRTSSCSGARPV